MALEAALWYGVVAFLTRPICRTTPSDQSVVARGRHNLRRGLSRLRCSQGCHPSAVVLQLTFVVHSHLDCSLHQIGRRVTRQRGKKKWGKSSISKFQIQISITPPHPIFESANVIVMPAWRAKPNVFPTCTAVLFCQ